MQDQAIVDLKLGTLLIIQQHVLVTSHRFFLALPTFAITLLVAAMVELLLNQNFIFFEKAN